jgi:4-amino-4-deoxy-L-arabinose transferase-like glycosyltransferase
MENWLIGTLAVLLSAVLFGWAYAQYRAQRTAWALSAIVLGGLVLRLYTATDRFLHPWDERYHALVAKNMAAAPFRPTLYADPVLPYDYRNWAGNHLWVHKQPLPLWGIAASLYVFGPQEWAVRLPSVLLSTLGIWLMFLIGRDLFSRRIGLIAAFLYAVHGLILELSAGRVATDHVDVFFLFFVQLSVWAAIRFAATQRALFNVLCGVSLGLAILCKWLPALIVLPIWALLLSRSPSFSVRGALVPFGVLVCTAAAVFLPWQVYIHARFPLEAAWESSFNRKHLTEALEGQGGPFWFHFDRARILYGELVYLPLTWWLYKTFQKPFRRRVHVLVAIWFLVPFLFFSFAATKMQGYTLFAAPAIFLITAVAFHFGWFYRRRFRYPRLAALVCLLLLVLPVRYSLERAKPFSDRERDPAWAREIRAFGRTLDPRERNVVFGAEHPIETMFYGPCSAYTEIPDEATLRRLAGEGYTVFVRGPGTGTAPAEEAFFFPERAIVYRRLPAVPSAR